LGHEKELSQAGSCFDSNRDRLSEHQHRQKTKTHNPPAEMPSITKIAGAVVGLAALASALPAVPRLNPRAMKMYEFSKRQNAAAAALGITDIDILQL